MKTPLLRYTVAAFALLALAGSGSALGHALGEDYVFFNFRESSIDGEFQIHVKDLRDKLGIDLSEEPTELAAAIVRTAPKVETYIAENFSIGPEDGEPYALSFTSAEYIDSLDGFGTYKFVSETGPLPDRLAISHRMFYDGDRLHRGLVLVQHNAKTGEEYGPENTALIFSPGNQDQSLDLTAVPGLVSTREMIWQGVLHIWIGIDHILFLVALLLSTVLVLQGETWSPVDKFRVPSSAC